MPSDKRKYYKKKQNIVNFNFYLEGLSKRYLSQGTFLKKGGRVIISDNSSAVKVSYLKTHYSCDASPIRNFETQAKKKIQGLFLRICHKCVGKTATYTAFKFCSFLYRVVFGQSKFLKVFHQKRQQL